MKSQNPIKRIVITSGLALATALMTLLIQHSTKEDLSPQKTLEAQVYPSNPFLLSK